MNRNTCRIIHNKFSINIFSWECGEFPLSLYENKNNEFKWYVYLKNWVIHSGGTEADSTVYWFDFLELKVESLSKFTG